MKTCYYCDHELEDYSCVQCSTPVFHFYGIDARVHVVTFKVPINGKSYEVFVDVVRHRCHIFLGKEMIMQLESTAHFTPTNASEKIKTIIMFS